MDVLEVSQNNALNKIKAAKKESVRDKMSEKLAKKFGEKFTSAKEKNAELLKISEKAKKKAKLEGKDALSKDGGSDLLNGKFNNDPNSKETTNKLKSLVMGNAFNFSEKERDVLSKIINK